MFWLRIKWEVIIIEEVKVVPKAVPVVNAHGERSHISGDLVEASTARLRRHHWSRSSIDTFIEDLYFLAQRGGFFDVFHTHVSFLLLQYLVGSFRFLELMHKNLIISFPGPQLMVKPSDLVLENADLLAEALLLTFEVFSMFLLPLSRGKSNNTEVRTFVYI